MTLPTTFAWEKFAVMIPPPQPQPASPLVTFRAITFPRTVALPAAKSATPPPLAAAPVLSEISLPTSSAAELPPM